MKRTLFIVFIIFLTQFAVFMKVNAENIKVYKGTITIYVGEEKTMYHSIPYQYYVTANGWFLRETNDHAWSDGQEECGVKIVSKTSESCTINGMWDNEPQFDGDSWCELHCKGTKNSTGEYYECYWKVIVKSRGTITVSATPSGGTVEAGTKVYLSASVSGAKIYYTTNGSIPNENSSLYDSSGITINQATTLKAIAYMSGYESQVNSWYYTVDSSSLIPIDATNFPDANFRAFLLEQDYGQDGQLSKTEINGIKSIDVRAKEISSLKGIEHFTALTLLWCRVNQLTELDISQNKSLTDLDCANNQLTSLNVSNNTALKELDCQDNNLSFLDISKNTALEILQCTGNQLQTLDVSNNSALKHLEIHSNKIKRAGMDALISSLPQHSNGSFIICVVYESIFHHEENECDEEQVLAIKSKGWLPRAYLTGWMWYDNIVLTNGITLNNTSLSLRVGEEFKLIATSMPENTTQQGFYWYSSNTDVVLDGVSIGTKELTVKAKSAGNAIITCEARDGSGTRAICTVTVTNPKPDKIVLPSEATVTAGQTITLTPTITPANAEYALTWSTDDETVATVNQDGVVTGVRKGKTFINVETDNGKTAYCKLTVTAAEPVNIELPKTATVYVGGTLTLTPTITPEGAETTLTWTSDDESVARISTNGVLTGVAEGLALVTVSTSNGLTSNACKVKVEPDPSGISTVMMDEKTGVPIYTPLGQRLSAPRKGINIVGGKKVIVK